jgi:hypothetical protein
MPEILSGTFSLVDDDGCDSLRPWVYEGVEIMSTQAQEKESSSQTKTVVNAASDSSAVAESTGAHALHRLLSQGHASPDKVAELLRQFTNSKDVDQIVALLQSDIRFGNSYVQQVLKALPQRAASTAPKAPPSPHRERHDPAATETKRTPGDLHFGAGEHQDIAAEANNAKIDRGIQNIATVTGGINIELAPGYSIPYADVVALAGDHFESIDQMRLFAANNGVGEGSRAEIEYARFWKLKAVAYHFDAATKAAQEARYYRAAGRNKQHFVNPQTGDSATPTEERVGQAPDPSRDTVLPLSKLHVPNDMPDAIAAYRYYHIRALTTAARAGAAKGTLNDAYAEEAFGDHFLTDSFSAGHMRTQRDSVQQYWNNKCPMFFYNLKGVVAEAVAKNLSINVLSGQVREDFIYDPPIADGAKTKVAAALNVFGKYGLGDLISVAIHDRDGDKGVRATANGNPVEMFGDGNLNKGHDTKRLAVEAVRLGIKDLEVAQTQGAKGMPVEQIIAGMIGKDHLFNPERLVPHALPDAQQGPEQSHTLWKFASYDELLADSQMQSALAIFAQSKGDEFNDAIKSFDKDKQEAIRKGFIEPLKANPAAMVRQIIDWTPTITDSAGGHNTDDHANDYWQEAKQTQGGLKSLTYVQRERLIDHLLGGWVIGTDEDAIMDILRTATPSEAKSLIVKVGRSKLQDKIDNRGTSEFENAVPHDKE